MGPSRVAIVPQEGFEQQSACYALRMRVDPKAVLKTLGAEVRRRRESLSLSQAMLAHRAQVHTNVVGRIERGSYNPTVLTLGAIAAALNTSLVEVLAHRESTKRAKLRAV